MWLHEARFRPLTSNLYHMAGPGQPYRMYDMEGLSKPEET